MHGYGTFMHTNSTHNEASITFKGNWSEGLRHGKGIELRPNGSFTESQWVNGTMTGLTIKKQLPFGMYIG